MQAVWTNNFVHNIATRTALLDGHDFIVRESSLQHSFQFKLLHFALKLLRALVTLAAQFLHLYLQVCEEFVFLCELEAICFLLFLLCGLADTQPLILEATLDLQFQPVLFLLKRPTFLAQSKFGIFCLR